MISPCLSVNQQGHLDISGCDTVDLARQYGTPLYVMSEDEVRRACRSYAASFQKYYGGNGRPIYASKAFSCKEIYRIVVSEGLDVVFRKNPAARVVCTAVTLETVAEAARLFAGLEGADMVQVSATRTRQAGRYHLMDAQNPVWIFSGEGRV